MNLRCVAVAVLFALVPGAAAAESGYYFYGPWSATLYAGPSTNSHFTKTFQGQFQVNGGMVGLAGDVRLYQLGGGWSFAGEGDLTQFAGKYDYLTAAGEIGVRYDNYPWSFAFYTGPSYATDPPKDLINFTGKRLLNAVSMEVAYGIPHSGGWGVALRLYHRSGAWGLYSPDSDEGTMLGIGIRKQF